MFNSRSKTFSGLGAALCLTASVSAGGYAQADEDEDELAFLIIGAAKNPEYFGSAAHDVVPFAVSQFEYRALDVEIEGLTAYALLKSRSRWRSGLAVELDTGRDEEVSSAVIALMRPIDPAANLGGLIGYSRPDFFLDDELELKIAAYTDVNDVHNGVYSTLALTYALPLMIPWRFEFEAETTYADASYMNTYFGIDPVDAARTGLDAYTPAASFRDLALTANVILFFSPQFGIFTRCSVSQLLDEAKSSPIVELGDDRQYFVGIGAFIRFGD